MKTWSIVYCLLSWATVVGCTSLPSGSPKTYLPSAPNQEKIVQQKNCTIKAVRLETDAVEGQTSWQIKPATSYTPLSASVEGITPPHIKWQLDRAFDLAQRGAIYSANNEFLAVLDLCALELDMRTRGNKHRTALQLGLTALQEADDFTKYRSALIAMEDIDRIAAAHRTPLRKRLTDNNLDAIAAVQLYYNFAEEHLAFACDGMPCASTALYGLGRTVVLMDMNEPLATARAALMHRTALAVAPSNHMAANELGVLLAQHGKVAEAEKLFRHAVAVDASSEAWQNLAIVYEKLGKDNESRRAYELSQALALETPAGQIPNPQPNGMTDVMSSPNNILVATGHLVNHNHILRK